jgi:transcriptional antiterminator NusG
MIYTVRTVIGREKVVLEAIDAKAKTENLQIKALVHPEELKGYIFVEGDLKDIEKSIKMIPHVRGLIRKPVELNKIQRFLQPKKAKIDINEGDLVEVIGGPFKTMKGKVTRYDKIKREVTIEPLEVAVPIPVTIGVEFVKVLEKAKK